MTIRWESGIVLGVGKIKNRMKLTHIEIVPCNPKLGDGYCVVIFRDDGEGTVIAQKEYRSWADESAKKFAIFFGVHVK